MTTRAIDEPSRPVIHLTPVAGWMNDPNGLCHHDGIWQACYQHNPVGTVHAGMHWRRAVSTDLSHWADRGVVLAPDHLGQIYSGSVVVDVDDTAGFGAGAMVAVFTHHGDGAERQSLAFSVDGGDHWQPFDANPVLESDEADFRDPKVFRHTGADGAWWVMALAVGRRVDLYRSRDLRSWTFASSVAASLPTDGVWECPDLVRLGDDSWLFVVSVADGGPHGHGGTLGARGHFDGIRFEATDTPRLLDHGPDWYAMQTFHGAPGAPTGLAWMSSWRYAATLPAGSWRGRMSVPRRFVLDATGALTMTPVVAPRTGRPVASRDVSTTWGEALVVDVADRASLAVVDDDDPAIRSVLTVDGDGIRLERAGPFGAWYAQTYAVPVATPGPARVILDHGGIEVFAGGGTATMSALVCGGPRWRLLADGDVEITAIR